MAISVGRLSLGSFTNATWTTVDLKTLVPEIAGATYALIEVDGTSSYAVQHCVRPAGGTEGVVNFSGVDAADQRLIFPCKLGANDDVDVYLDIASRANVYLLGYGSEITWITPVDLGSNAPTDSWHTYDLSAHVPAEAGFALMQQGTTWSNFRAVGETFDTSVLNGSGSQVYRREVIKLNAAKELEAYVKSSGNSPQVVGWIPDGQFSYIENPAPQSVATAGVWETFPSVDPNVLFAFISVRPLVSDADNVGEHGFRVPGSGDTLNTQLAIQNHTYFPTSAGQVEFTSNTAQGNFWYRGGFIPSVAATPTLRKSSTFDIETTLGTITTATLNGVNVFDHVSQAGTTVSFAGAATDEITTSGEYSLVLGDGTGTQTITVQVNVVGLASFNINKDGADQGSLTDVEFVIMTGAAGSRAINDQIINVTTTAGGDTGAIEITDTALNVGDTIMVAQRSDSVSGGGGAFHPATLGLI